MLFDDVVRTLDSVTATGARRTKTAALATLLRALAPAEIVPAIGMLTAKPRQGRLGVGWRSLAARGGRPADSLAHAAEPSLEILDVDDAFEHLARAEGAGSVAARAEALTGLSEKATAPEWALIQRIILGELRTGALEGVLLDAVAAASERGVADVRRAAMLSGSLAETARIALTEPADVLAGVGLQPGRPVMPMLASTAPDASSAVELVGEASVEDKLDGARIQVHRFRDADGTDAVRVYTRSLADITHRVPEIVAVVRALPAQTLILDGETLALDEDGQPRPFQDTMSRFGSESAGPDAGGSETDGSDAGATGSTSAPAVVATGLRPWFFDLLHVDGRDLIDEPLSVRLDELDRVVGELRVRGVRTSDPDVAEDFAGEALAAGREGVMVKQLDAPYAAGRRGKSWLKVKPVLTFDLVVLGVEWGSGRRTGLLSNIHLGARDPEGLFGDPGGLVMVGKTFKGLTDETLRWQTEHFRRIRIGESPGVVWVEPITVVEIAIDGVQRSTRYPGGVALRFARVKGYRPDKTPEGADTIAALRELLH